MQKIQFFFRRHLLFSIFILIFTVSTICAFVFYGIEFQHNPDLDSFGKAVWWVLVSITTVGYGDVVPVTESGRILGVFIIFTGVALFSMFTATVSSIFVAQKLREDRGLKQITLKNHIILCGWNETVEQILETIFLNMPGVNVVLINQLPEDQVQEFLLKFRGKSLKYVRGDYSHEEILNRANVNKARIALLVPDRSPGISTRGDEKTIFSALSIRSLHPKINIYAHILDPDNEPYLKKAKIDDYIVSDAFSGILLGEMIAQPGIPQSIKKLLTTDRLARISIPQTLVGKSFNDALNYFREKGFLPIALVEEKKPLSFSNILSEDYSSLDEFIERKFKEAGRSLKIDAKLDVELNPRGETILKEDQFLIIIK